MKLEKYNKNKLDLENFKKEFLEEKKRKKGKIIKEIFDNNKDMMDEDYYSHENSDQSGSDLDILFRKKRDQSHNSNNNKINNEKHKKIHMNNDQSEEETLSSDWDESEENSLDNNISDDDFSDSLKRKPKVTHKNFEINMQNVKLLLLFKSSFNQFKL